MLDNIWIHYLFQPVIFNCKIVLLKHSKDSDITIFWGARRHYLRLALYILIRMIPITTFLQSTNSTGYLPNQSVFWGYPMREGGWLNIFVFTIPIELQLYNRCEKHFINCFMWSTQHCSYQGTAHWEWVIKLA